MHSLIPEILWVRNFCQSIPFFPLLPLFQAPFPPNPLREGCSLLSSSIFFLARFSGYSLLSPAHLHSQSHPNHPGSPTFPPGTSLFSLSRDKSSPRCCAEGYFLLCLAEFQGEAGKGSVGAIFRPWICLSDRVGELGMAGRTQELEDGNRTWN